MYKNEKAKSIEIVNFNKILIKKITRYGQRVIF